MQEENTYWYAVHTRPRWEKKCAADLQNMGIENYCPLNKVVRQWSDRKKVILEPLFKGYVFVRVEEAKKWELLDLNSIVNYVHWLGKPARIRDEEIDTIRKFLHEFSDVEIIENSLAVKKEVQVKQGAMMNYRGIILELHGNKAKVRIESMGIQMSAFFDKKNLELI
jgi:transcription antitermination factor NusG